jgi:hypothetical protein
VQIREGTAAVSIAFADRNRTRLLAQRHLRALGLPIAALLIGALTVRSPVLATAGVLAGVLAFTPPWMLLFGALLTARGFDVLLARSGTVSWQSVSALLAAVAVVKWAATRPATGRKPPTRTSVLLIGFLGWFLIAPIADGTMPTAPLRLAPFILLPIAYHYDPEDERRFITGVVWFAIIEMLWSASQLTTRLQGVHVVDPHQMGFLLIATLAALLSDTATVPTPRLFTAITVFGILMTRTRGVWLATIVLFALWMMPRVSGRRVLFIVGGVIVAGILLFAPATQAFDLNPHSADIRNESISAGIKLAKQHPAFGLGWTSPQSPSPTQPQPDPQLQATDQAKNDVGTRPYDLLVFLAVVGGLPAALIFAALLVDTLSISARRHFAALLFFGAFAAFSLSESPLYPGSLTAPLFFCFLAFAANSPNLIARQTRSAEATAA